MLFDREFTKPLDHITLLNSVKDRQNPILNMVINNFKVTNWVEFYGLNILETMELDYGKYRMMNKVLKEHSKVVDDTADKFKDKILNDIKK